MEPLGVAASIIAVTTIALQSTKAVYATVNGIKNGPQEVNDLASAVKHLSHILEHVAEISKGFSDMDGTDLYGLERAMEECAQSLAEFRKQVKKLDVLPDERKLKKVKKRVKCVIQKGDFRRMWETVNHYINLFGTHLSLIGRRRDHTHNNDFARHIIQTGTDSKALKQNNDMLKQLKDGLGGLQNGLTGQEAQRKLETHLLKAGQQAAESLEERLNDLAAMSTRQHETIMENLARIQNQVEEGKASTVPTPEMFTPKVAMSDNSREEKADNNTEDSQAGNELSESIDRLCSLATKPRTTAYSDQAQQIIGDLEKILCLVSMEAKSPEPVGARKRKHDQQAGLEFAEVSRYPKQNLDLKKLQGLLISSRCISVNEQASFDASITSENRRYRKTTFQKYDTNVGSVFVHFKKRRLMGNADHGENNILIIKPDEEVEEIFEGRVNFIPKRTDRQTKISTSFMQRVTKDGFFSLKPRLSFCAIIPHNSEIFAFVEDGDLKGIMDHLQQGKASLSDCDPEGCTLLNYALNHKKDEICKFLIDKGADVDAMEPCLGEDIDEERNYFASPLDRINRTQYDDDCPQKELTSVLNCRRLLLNAGADPMPHGSFGELFENALNSYTTESLALILNLGGEFVNYEGRDKYGQTLLLYSSMGFGYGLQPHCIKMLLDHGASVTATNNFGETCLHLALDWLRFPEKTSEKDSLLLLVKAGADVYATDYSGISVSDVANKRERIRGAYTRDLWNEVLTECGYDPTAVHERDQELEEVSDSGEEVFDSEEGVSGSEEGVSDSVKHESMIEEQDCELDGQDFNDPESTCGIIMEAADIQCNNSSPVENGLLLPGVMKETLDANIWRQTDSSMPEDIVCGESLPSITDNQYIFSQHHDLSGFKNNEQPNYPYLAQDPAFSFNNNDQSHHHYLQNPASGLNNPEQPHYAYLQGSASGLNYTEQSPYLAQGAASISSTFQGNSSFFDMGDEMKDWDNNVWG